MISPSEEDFELELRSLPGVLNVGVLHRENGDVDAVTLFVRGQDPGAVRDLALQVTSLYFPDAVVTIEDASQEPTVPGRQGARVILAKTDFRVDEGISEVHLSYEGRVGVGRSDCGPLIGGAEATLDALRELGFEIPFYLVAVTSVATVRGWPVIVTLRPLANDGDRIGIAQADGDIVSSARATLDALNRFVSFTKERPSDEASTDEHHEPSYSSQGNGTTPHAEW